MEVLITGRTEFIDSQKIIGRLRYHMCSKESDNSQGNSRIVVNEIRWKDVKFKFTVVNGERGCRVWC